jgi:hypothetical protein
MHISPITAKQDMAVYLGAVASAERRALSSYFDQHVLLDGEGVYLTIDQGDYPDLPPHLIDRIVHTVPGGLLDEF